MSFIQGLFYAHFYVAGTADGVLYTEVSFIQGCPLRGVPSLPSYFRLQEVKLVRTVCDGELGLHSAYVNQEARR